VGAGADGIRAALVHFVGNAPRLVTYTSNGGAGTSVESADLSPTFAANANVDTAVSADGSYASAIVAFKTLYAAPTTAGAKAKVLDLSNAVFRPQRTAKGAVVSDLFNTSDTLPLLRQIDFVTATDQVLHGAAKAVTETQLPSGLYSTDVTIGATSVTQITAWRYVPGAGRTDVATAAISNANPPPSHPFATATTPDGSNYVVALEGTDAPAYYSQVYSVSLASGAAGFRPMRKADYWAVGGDAILGTQESGKLRLEDLSSGAKPAAEVPLPSALAQAKLRRVSRSGRVGFFELSDYDSTAKGFVTGFDALSDTGAHKTLWAPNLLGVIDEQAAWTDGIVLVLDDGFYFFR
jgi:hypothetical protein